MTDASLFRVEKVTDHCFAAIARPVPRLNCNAAVVVTSEWILVVDTHSRPSAARALLARIRTEWPNVPVRFVVNTHFHWDHVQGNSAYTEALGSAVELISTDATLDLMRCEGRGRLRDTVESGDSELLELRRSAGVQSSDPRNLVGDRIEGLERYCRELRGASLQLPTRTFGESCVLRSRELAVHLLAPGRGHTAGDLVVHLPDEGVLVTGDLLQGIVPCLTDAYPDEWISTLNALAGLQFSRVVPGHGAVQNRGWLFSFVKDYLTIASQTVLNGLEQETPLDVLQASFVRDLNKLPDWPKSRQRILDQMREVFGRSSEQALDEAIRQSLRDTWAYYSGG